MVDKGFINRDKVFNLYEEFKKFAFRGNVISLAVGVVIGNCFGKIVTSLVNNVLMPLSTAFLPSGEGGGYKSWYFEINGSPVPYGLFLGDLVTFLILTFVLFLVIRKLLVVVFDIDEKKEIPADQKLLSEIRDIMKENFSKPKSTPRKRTSKRSTKK